MSNTLITLSDSKIGVDINADNKADFYTASVLSATDYYAFGMSMKERSWQSESYRYGFNGQERDRDIREDGNHTTAEFWEYSAVIGRRWNIDPVVDPSISSYATNENNPIRFIDPNGNAPSDIIILAQSDGANGAGHRAVLIGNQKDGWTYISKDGFQESAFGSASRYTQIKFGSIKEFANSEHNMKLKNGYIHSYDVNSEGVNGIKNDKGILSDNLLQKDEHGNRIQRYDKAFYIDTDEKSNEKMIYAALGVAKDEYCLMKSDCSDIAGAALSVGEDRNGKAMNTGETKTARQYIPNGPSMIGSLIGRTIYDEAPNKKYHRIQDNNSAIGYDATKMIVHSTLKR